MSSSSSATTTTTANNSDDLNALTFYQTLRACKDTYLSSHLNQALDTLADALRLYGPDNVFSSYNGGKDADVIMHLLRAVCGKYATDHQCECLPRLVYFAIEDEFDEVIQHIDANEQRYGLQLTRYNCGIVQVSPSSENTIH
jgi:FAD synthetase